MYFPFKETAKSKKMNELIAKYFENSLTPQEQLLFEEKLQQDAEFEAEFEFHAALKKAVTVAERQKIKAQIQKFESNEKDTIKVFSLRKLMPYAAVFLVVISIGLFFILNQKNESNQLYASYFEPYPNIEVSNLRANTKKTLENQAFTVYDLEDYKLAQTLFTKLLENNSKDYLHFYNGMCLMQLENFDFALEELNTIKATNSKYYEKALWFKALIFIKLNKKEDAKKLLNELVTNLSFKNKEAKQLLSKL